MASKKPKITALINKYVKQYQEDLTNKKLSKRGLAQMLFDKYPELFKDVESARSAIRYRTGANGEHLRSITPTLPFIDVSKPANNEELIMPESHAEDWLPYYVGDFYNALILSDIHIPYQDNQALEAALNYGLEQKVDCIILNGDILDMHTLSKYQKNPRARSFGEELEATVEFLRGLRDLFPTQEIIFKTGNHCVRYRDFMLSKSIELLDVKGFSLDGVLELEKLNIRYVTDKRPIKFGDLTILHGHECGVSSQHPALNLFRKVMVDAVCGHVHRTDAVQRKDLNGKWCRVWTTGCLSEMHPDFARINQWNLGFGHAIRNKQGAFNFHNKIIVNGHVL